MLLKYSQAQKRMKSTGTGKPQRATGMMKMTSGLMNVVPRIHRKVLKAASKRPNSHHRSLTVSKREERAPVDPCDNSNDSGLGFDHHLEYQTAPQTSLRFSEKEWWNYSAKPTPKHRMSCITSVFRPPDSAVHLACWPEESPEVKRRRLEIKLESDDANDNFTFPETNSTSRTSLCVPVNRVVRSKISPTSSGFNLPQAPLTLSSQLNSTSRNGQVYLQILCQPEQQHRARYQTEGSRGAVKDRTGNGFPVVKLVGYDQPASLQVFIGTDQGRVVPHMFYQACRVSGKNSTPCTEKKVDGTIVIEVDVEPSKDMVVTCDCVGILKERNVDVEHRFPEEGSGRSKKKSTRCRMVFRTSVTHPDGTVETLQVTSQPIVCTQPPGVPEICKKSLTSCPVTGGQELFILGKNFLKDTRVIFQEGEGNVTWKQSVQPDKEFLQQSHLVCTVPAYQRSDITEPVSVRLCVESSGKSSEPHTFLYTPVTTSSDKSNSTALSPDGNLYTSGATGTSNNPSLGLGSFMSESSLGVSPAQPLLLRTDTDPTFIPSESNTGQEEKVHPVMLWPTPLPAEKPIDIASQMMPPPPLLPISMRRPSLQMIVPEISQEELKKEIPENSEVSQNFVSVTDLTSTQSPSMDTFRRFVSEKSNVPLPSLSVENYLSNLEGVNSFPKEQLKSQIIPDVPGLIDQTVVKTVYEEPAPNLINNVQTVMMRSSPPLDFSTSVSNQNSNISQESFVNKTVSETTPVTTPLQVRTMELQHSSLISEEQKARLDALVSSALVAPTSATERQLDAFVNSAADSHMSPVSSPTILSPVADTSCISPIQVITVPETSHMNPIQTLNVSETAHISPIQALNVSETAHISPIQALNVSETTHISPIQALNVSETAHISPIQALNVSETAHISPIQTLNVSETAHIGPIQTLNVSETAHISPIQTLNVSETAHIRPIQTMAVKESSHLNPIQTITVSDISHINPMTVSDATHMNAMQNLAVVTKSSHSDPNITIIHQNTRPLSQILQDTPSTQSSLCSLLSSTQNMVPIDHLSSQPMNLTQSSLSIGNSSQYETQKVTAEMSSNQNVELKESNQFLISLQSNPNMERKESNFLLPTQESVIVSALQKQETSAPPPPQVKKCEEGMPLPHELTNMSEHDLLSYINTSYFDKV